MHLGACPDENQIAGFLDGTLGVEDSSALEAHLDGCDACRSVVAAAIAASGLDAVSHLETNARVTAPAAAPAAAPLLPPGTIVGRYEVRGTLGSGGMGVVYDAWDPQLERGVALKLVRAEDLGEESAEGAERLQREAKAMARISHPNVVSVFDAGTFREQVFVAMERVDGSTLRQWLLDAPRGTPEVLRAFVEAGKGLAAAHAAGLVHRDFKPENVLVGRAGQVRVTDFGLARIGSHPAVDGLSAPSGAVPLTITRTGAVLGTPAYMAPEQFAGRNADARCDQFAFCVALWEALFGERPFEGGSLRELSQSVQAGRIRAPSKRVAVAPAIREALRRGISADPKARHPDLPALLRILEGALDGRKRRRAAWVAAAALGAVALLGNAFLLDPSRACAAAGNRLRGVWDETSKARVRVAFEKTGAPWAADAWRGVEQSLDRWTGTWVAARVEACEATHVHRSQSEELLDRRMACLDGRLRDARSLVEVFAQADRKVVEKASSAVSSLPALDRCADADALLAASPPPEPAIRARATALSSSLADVRALRAAGRYDEALDRGARAAAEARRLEYRPLLAEALLAHGRVRMVAADPHEAQSLLEEALATAVAAREDETAAGASVALVASVGMLQGRYEEALRAARQAEAAVERAGNDPSLRADLYTNRAAALHYLGRLDEALEEHRRALAVYEQLHGAEHAVVGEALVSIGGLLDEMGRVDEAHATLERAKEIVHATLGPEHPSAAYLHGNLGLLALGREDFAAAERELAHSLAVVEKTGAGRSAIAATVLMNLGAVHDAQDRLEEALALYERALALNEELAGPDSPDVAMCLVNVAQILADLGRGPEAETRLRRALEIGKKSLPPEHVVNETAVRVLSELLQAQGRVAEAASVRRGAGAAAAHAGAAP